MNIKDPWQSFWSRKGGTARAIRGLVIGVFILSCVVFFYLAPKVKNYQGAHKRLADIETFISHICKDVPPAECRPSIGQQCQCD